MHIEHRWPAEGLSTSEPFVRLLQIPTSRARLGQQIGLENLQYIGEKIAPGGGAPSQYINRGGAGEDSADERA